MKFKSSLIHYIVPQFPIPENNGHHCV